jgi:MinD-like ATPase involved in chromosome partitioning or flagellar assembly
LTGSDLTILISDYHVDNVLAAKNTITLLKFLGISPDKMAALLVDAEGKHPELTAVNLKTYVEANLGITLMEIISYDAKIYQTFYLESQPVIQSNINEKFGQDIRRIARYIISFNYRKTEIKRPQSEVPAPEMRN